MTPFLVACSTTLQAGIVSAAPDKNESSKARRKRKHQEGGAAGSGSQAEDQKAMWANPKTQKRMFR